MGRDVLEVALQKIECGNWLIIVSKWEAVHELRSVVYEQELRPGDIAHLEVGGRGLAEVFRQEGDGHTRLIHLTLK